MPKSPENLSIADLLGPWVEPDFDSGLIDRCRAVWPKPLGTLSKTQLAMLLRQKIAIEHVLPIARKRLENGVDDDTEMHEGELRTAVDQVSEGQ